MRLKGIHDIKTARDLGIKVKRVNVHIRSEKGYERKAFKPHVWTFTTNPGFSRCERFLKVEKVKEPITEIEKEANELTIMVRLPGVTEKDIKMEVQGDILSIRAEEVGGEEYRKEMLLPWTVDSSNMNWTYEDGVLELKLKKP